MSENTTSQTSHSSLDASIENLRDEFDHQRMLFYHQPPILQRFIEVQGRLVAEAFAERSPRLRFTLPDRVFIKSGQPALPIPEKSRLQKVGRFADKLAGRDVHLTLKQKLVELESSPEESIVVAAGLIRFAAAQFMIHSMLPSGRSVTYKAAEGEEIPSIPVGELDPESAITSGTDAIAEEGNTEDGRGSLQVPYVPAARRFYLPQWVAFDDQGTLLVNSTDEAKAHIASMQKFLEVLFAARSLAPYMVADDEFEKKRDGMLGQLVNQGRLLALHTTGNIIATIKQRAAEQSLNRGLGLHLPYFDDQFLTIEHHDFVVIPAGRIMFVPAFMVRATQDEQAKVSQDTRLNPSTRKHLLYELAMLEAAFRPVK
jgi:hypothetical protein